MRYIVTIGDRVFEVDLAGDVPRVDGVPFTVDSARVAGGAARHLLIDSRSITVVPARGDAPGRWEIRAGGYHFDAHVEDERTRALRAFTRTTAAVAGPQPLVAPMPGLVVRILVEPGQEVVAGQALVTIEAMKMQNELAAVAPGTVTRVAVAAGEAVERGAVLIEFE
ncbi:MAG TPA: biotin/lipoyl-containing protein [Longimicrobiales bacterium]|nr:biotin/lipoyl-containing protein [Longimicrobiales bacterium]